MVKRKRYKIKTKEDAAIAKGYIMRMKGLKPSWPKLDMPENSFAPLNAEDPESIQQWINQWLTEEQFRKLRTALRKMKAGRNNKTESMTVSGKTRKMISYLAHRNGLKIDTFLKQRLENEYKKAKREEALDG